MRRAAGRRYSYFHLYMRVCMYLCVYLFMCVTPPGQTKNDTDLTRQSRRYAEIYVTRQFFEANVPHGHIFEKTKKPYLEMV